MGDEVTVVIPCSHRPCTVPLSQLTVRPCHGCTPSANLIYLFEVIDVDSSGEVSWEEFLDFCAEAGDWKTKAVSQRRQRADNS